MKRFITASHNLTPKRSAARSPSRGADHEQRLSCAGLDSRINPESTKNFAPHQGEEFHITMSTLDHNQKKSDPQLVLISAVADREHEALLRQMAGTTLVYGRNFNHTEETNMRMPPLQSRNASAIGHSSSQDSSANEFLDEVWNNDINRSSHEKPQATWLKQPRVWVFASILKLRLQQGFPPEQRLGWHANPPKPSSAPRT